MPVTLLESLTAPSLPKRHLRCQVLMSSVFWSDLDTDWVATFIRTFIGEDSTEAVTSSPVLQKFCIPQTRCQAICAVEKLLKWYRTGLYIRKWAFGQPELLPALRPIQSGKVNVVQT